MFSCRQSSLAVREELWIPANTILGLSTRSQSQAYVLVFSLLSAFPLADCLSSSFASVMSEPTSEIPVLDRGPQDGDASPPKTASFWLSLLAITIATFLAALDTVSHVAHLLTVRQSAERTVYSRARYQPPSQLLSTTSRGNSSYGSAQRTLLLGSRSSLSPGTLRTCLDGGLFCSSVWRSSRLEAPCAVQRLAWPCSSADGVSTLVSVCAKRSCMLTYMYSRLQLCRD